MTVSANMLSDLRRMVAEPTTATYDNALLTRMIERYPLPDAYGRMRTSDDWTATYDLNSAARDVWEEKAAALAAQFDFSDGKHLFKVEQKYSHAVKQARRYNARRAIRAVPLTPGDPETASSV